MRKSGACRHLPMPKRFRPPRVADIAITLSLREADIRRLLKSSLAKMAMWMRWRRIFFSAHDGGEK